MHNPEIKKGQLWRHYKGNHYEILALGKHSESGEELVGYRREEDGKIYFRPKSMFFDSVQWEGVESPRFVLVSGVSAETRNLWIEAYGWYGAVGLLAAYLLSSFSVLSPESAWYQLINVTAALGIVTVSLYKKTYQPGILNIIWAGIGIVALIRILL